MEEKILNALAEMNQKFDKKFDTLDQKLENGLAELDRKFQRKIDEMDEKFEKKFDEMHKEMNCLREEVNQNMNHLAQKILDRQFVFEDEYGRKIDAIFEYVEFHQKNNLQRFDRINKLEDRVEKNGLQILDHEKRISALERKSV